MKLTTILLGGLAAAAVALTAPATSPAPKGVTVTADVPTSLVVGQPMPVTLTYTAEGEASSLEAFRIGAGAFTVNGEALGERGEGELALPMGSELTFTFDLAPALSRAGVTEGFNYSVMGVEGTRDVAVMRAAPEGLNFMDPESVATEALAGYRVLLSTNRGDMIVKFYPHLAPNHVRNFLDLAYTDFYDGVTFHRVIPGFMIQGGDPQGTGMGNGPRRLQAEFSPEPHVRGILSMARTSDPNSASSQFFIMHAAYPSLDNQYSVFGMLESGFDVLDAIVTTPRSVQDRPNTPQVIQSATVLAPQ